MEFEITTLSGEVRRGTIEEADSANGIWLDSGHSETMFFSWKEIDSIQKV